MSSSNLRERFYVHVVTNDIRRTFKRFLSLGLHTHISASSICMPFHDVNSLRCRGGDAYLQAKYGSTLNRTRLCVEIERLTSRTDNAIFLGQRVIAISAQKMNKLPLHDVTMARRHRLCRIIRLPMSHGIREIFRFMA